MTYLTNLCRFDIELRKCCGRCFGAVPALRCRESVGFAFLRGDERLYEVGGVNGRLIENATFRSPRNTEKTRAPIVFKYYQILSTLPLKKDSIALKCTPKVRQRLSGCTSCLQCVLFMVCKDKKRQ